MQQDSIWWLLLLHDLIHLLELESRGMFLSNTCTYTEALNWNEPVETANYVGLNRILHAFKVYSILQYPISTDQILLV